MQKSVYKEREQALHILTRGPNAAQVFSVHVRPSLGCLPWSLSDPIRIQRRLWPRHLSQCQGVFHVWVVLWRIHLRANSLDKPSVSTLHSTIDTILSDYQEFNYTSFSTVKSCIFNIKAWLCVCPSLILYEYFLYMSACKCAYNIYACVWGIIMKK